MTTIQSSKPTSNPAFPAETPPASTDPETRALTVLSALGAILAEPEALVRFENPAGLPAVHHLAVFFDGCAGAGQITGTDLFSPEDGELLESDDAEALLESTVPMGGHPGALRRDAPTRVALGTLLDGAALALLDTLHPGWPDGEGTSGEIEVRWTPNADGTLRTAIGGTIAYRRLVTTTYPFRAMESSPIRTSAVS